MNAFVKIVGIDKPIEVQDCQKIIARSKKTGSPALVANLESCSFDADQHYVLTGNTRLHIDGAKIEYVLFKP